MILHGDGLGLDMSQQEMSFEKEIKYLLYVPKEYGDEPYNDLDSLLGDINPEDIIN